MKEKFSNLLNKHGSRIILLISIVTSICATYYYFHNGQILEYGDARSHLDIARRVVDNKTPGFGQLGGTWLPIPHLLMLPFIINHFLWTTGLAGSIVSMIAYIFASVFIYKSVYLTSKNSFISIIAAFIFMFNLNILYMQSTPMTELVLLSAMIIGTYYFISWLYSKDIIHLLMSGLAIMLATLSRYDGWFLLFICIGLVFVENFFFQKSKKKAEGQTIIYTSLGSLGIFLWFVWNFLIWKNPFYFLNGKHSAQHQQMQLEAAGMLPTKHHLLLSVTTFIKAAYMNIGIVLFIFGIVSLLYLIILKIKDRRLMFSLILFISPLLFNIISLFAGVSTIRTDTSNMFNIRYGVMLIPFIAFAIGNAISNLPTRIKYVFCVIVLILICIPYNVVTLYDPLYGTSGIDTTIKKEILSDYKGGNILASVISFDPNMQEAGIPLHNYIHEGNQDIWLNALKNPAKSVSLILMKQDANNDPVYAQYIKNKNKYLKSFKVIYQKDNYLFLSKI